MKFDYKKAVQSLNFFAIKNGGQINKLKAIKLIYFADRYHLRKYGRPTTNDDYFAMSYGPVGSGVKDISEMSEFLGSEEKKDASLYIKSPDPYKVESIKNSKAEIFSESDLEALLFAWNKFGQYDEFELAEITHKYPEWKKHKQVLEDCSRVRMDYKDFFSDPPDNIEKCYPLSHEDKEDRIAHIEEIAKIDALWG